jgi:chloramphenicol 3-O-phosphotransferase
MKLATQMVLKGVFTIEHRDASGNLKEKFDIDNTVTTTGKAAIASLIQGAQSARFLKIALDASSTAAAAANTTLASEITSPSLKRAASTNTIVTTTVTDDTSQLLHTFNSTATQTVYGVGVFNTATSGGTLVSRTTFAAKNLVSGDTLQVTHKLIVA